MKKTGLIALGAAVALVAVVLAAGQIGRGTSGDGRVAPQGTPSPLTTDSDELSRVVTDTSADSFEPSGGEVPAAGDVDPAGGGLPSTSNYGGDGGENVAPPLPEMAGHKIIREATVSLEVEDVGAAVQQVESIAAGAGGFVSASSVFVETPPEPVEGDAPPPKRTQTATVTIRVPADAYASVVSKLRGIAEEVRSESSTASDVSEEFADLEARLRNLEATEGQYLALLKQAKTIPDILMLQDRINAVRLEIERIQGRLNLLNDLTDLATIVVQMGPPAAALETATQPGWAEEAWDNAWEASQDVLEAMGTAAIVGGVVLVWIVVPGLAILIGWRLLGPHRPREGGAGPSAGSG